MKYFITTLLLASSLFSTTQLLAHDSYWKDSSGAYVKNSTGECWMSGAHTADEAKCGSMHDEMAAAPAAAPTPTPTPAPALRWLPLLK
ncbi:MAG: hypothetical protein HOC92_13265 [Gammaproteobacteria bacterium]|nr:hypothetical protein [Gammaproteobacteria bacterium]